MHDREVIISRAADDPVGPRHPIIIRLSSKLNIFVMNRDIIIAIPSGMFVGKAQDVAQFVRRHPLALSPPKSGDINVVGYSLFKSDVAGVVALIGLAGKVDILRFITAGDKLDARASVHPPLHGPFDLRFLCVGELINVVRDNAARPCQWLFRICCHVRRI